MEILEALCRIPLLADIRIVRFDDVIYDGKVKDMPFEKLYEIRYQTRQHVKHIEALGDVIVLSLDGGL